MTSELKSMFGEKIPEQTTQTHRISKKMLEKKKKDLIKKHRGMKRELIKLIGGMPSIVERTENKGLKNNSNWIWAPFSNPARTDNLKLVHWQRAEDINKDYDFAKLNQSIDIVEFTKEEYDNLIKPNDRNWNYEQTCYLWELIKRYELRFIVIMDRFDEEKYGERTVESLKDRYYSVAKIILENRKMFDHPIIKSGYNYEQEMKRRTYLEKTMNKTFAELREEQDLFEMNENLNKKEEENDNSLNQKQNELKLPTFTSANQIINKNNNNTIQIPMNFDENENINSENKNLNNNVNDNSFNSNLNQNRINIVQFPTNNENSQTFEEFIKENITINDSFVYLRSQKLKHNLPVSEKIQERVDNYMKEINIPKLIPTAKVEIAYDNLRNNIILYTSLKKYFEKKDKEYIFLQNKVKEYHNKKNPNNINNNKYEKLSILNNKSNLKFENQNEIKEEENRKDTNENKTINSNDISNDNNNTINSIDQETVNNNGDSNSFETKEKRKKIRKRKNPNEEEITNEEKEKQFIFKKRKRGINK